MLLMAKIAFANQNITPKKVFPQALSSIHVIIVMMPILSQKVATIHLELTFARKCMFTFA